MVQYLPKYFYTLGPKIIIGSDISYISWHLRNLVRNHTNEASGISENTTVGEIEGLYGVFPEKCENHLEAFSAVSVWNHLTLPKTNMDTQNDGLEK